MKVKRENIQRSHCGFWSKELWGTSCQFHTLSLIHTAYINITSDRCNTVNSCNITFHCYFLISSLWSNLLTVSSPCVYIRTSDFIQPSSLKVYALCPMYSHFPHPWHSLFQLSTSESISLDPTFEWNYSELTILYLVHFTLHNVFQIHLLYFSYITLHCYRFL